MLLIFTIIGAMLLDWLLGEPRRLHPLVGFGYLAKYVEAKLYLPSRVVGGFALALLLIPFIGIAIWLSRLPDSWGTVFSIWALYFALGHKSLHVHTWPIITALHEGNEDVARIHVARIVSRDAATLKIVPAACESVLENGNDGVFGALFWFVCAGAPGVILYRLSNTLDAMWGYKNTRYRQFGWAAARLDDVLNWLPARLTACTYVLLGNTRRGLRCWHQQASLWDSPNAGPVMAAGAGALQVQLGGAAQYQGEWHDRPVLGEGCEPSVRDIDRALHLVRHGVVLWLIFLLLWTVLHA